MDSTRQRAGVPGEGGVNAAPDEDELWAQAARLLDPHQLAHAKVARSVVARDNEVLLLDPKRHLAER